MSDSVYDGDHDGVVRIFVDLSCEPKRLISYLINYIIIYITWNNFSPTRSVIYITWTIGNRTPGSRFYSDLLDTLADFICIHQLVLKPVQSLQVPWLVPINAH